METSPLNRVSVSEQIFEQLKAQIIKGELKPGERLPSENSLCKLYGVSRTTIRQALANLSSIKLIETRVGEGSFVMEASGAQIMAPFMSKAYLGKQSVLDIVELRHLIEPTLTEYACEKAEPEDIEKLEEIYNQMKANQNNLPEFAKLDCAFHTQIAKSSGNIYLVKIAEIINDILLNAFFDIVAVRGNKSGLHYHKLMLEAFQNKEPNKAKEIMQEHMRDMLESIEKEVK